MLLKAVVTKSLRAVYARLLRAVYSRPLRAVYAGPLRAVLATSMRSTPVVWIMHTYNHRLESLDEQKPFGLPPLILSVKPTQLLPFRVGFGAWLGWCWVIGVQVPPNYAVSVSNLSK